MDLKYKNILLKSIKAFMKSKVEGFELFKIDKSHPSYEVFTGTLMYRRQLSEGKAVWILWSPGPDVERYFFVRLGWSSAQHTVPHLKAFHDEIFRIQKPLASIAAGSIDLEQVEGKNALSGFTIPSPWDQVNNLKPTTPKKIQSAMMLKAQIEANALTDADIEKVTLEVVDDVFNRITKQLPEFIQAIQETNFV